MVEWYKRFEQYSLQSTVTCLAMTDAWNCDSILEVGCGPGLHSEFIAKNYLKSDSTLVSCDFSPQMVLAMK
jgi:trans-aconitate methyltransferase